MTRNSVGIMSGKTIPGIALVIIGLVALAYQGVTYTTHKKIVDIGPIQATREEHHIIALPPILGTLALIGGFLSSSPIGVAIRSDRGSTSL